MSLHQIKKWMLNEINSNQSDYFDDAGEPQYTQLGEAAILEFDINQENEEEIFDLSVDLLDERK